MITFAVLLTIGVIVFLGHAVRNEAWRWRWYRRRKGGSWYKYQMTGQLPGTTGTFWSQTLHASHRYYDLIKQEHYYGKSETPPDDSWMDTYTPPTK